MECEEEELSEAQVGEKLNRPANQRCCQQFSAILSRWHIMQGSGGSFETWCPDWKKWLDLVPRLNLNPKYQSWQFWIDIHFRCSTMQTILQPCEWLTLKIPLGQFKGQFLHLAPSSTGQNLILWNDEYIFPPSFYGLICLTLHFRFLMDPKTGQIVGSLPQSPGSVPPRATTPTRGRGRGRGTIQPAIR